MSGIGINTNVAALAAQRRLAESSEKLARSFERLSAGMRINRASDDAAGLAIAESLRADSRVFTQAIRNVNDGISTLNIAQGALSELSSITTRQRELATQAASGTYSLQQRRALNNEANALVSEFNRIVESTDFNGLKLFDQNLGDIRIQAGMGTSGGISFGIGAQLSRTVGDGTFEAVSSMIAFTNPSSIGMADLDGNGTNDIVATSSSGTGAAVVFFGNGDGSFSSPLTLSSSGLDIRSLILTDVNDDSRLDIVSSLPGQDAVGVFINQGGRSFSPIAKYTCTSSGFADTINPVVDGDFNGDGNVDLLVPPQSAEAVTLLLGNGNGTFSAYRSIGLGGQAFGIGVGDFNGDGLTDAIVAQYDDGATYTALIGNGNGTFRNMGEILVSPDWATDAEAGDFNNDGILDFALAIGSAAQNVGIMIGNGDGTFKAPIKYATGSSFELEVGDLNGDGVLDLINGDLYTTDNIEVLIGQGDGTFRVVATYTGGGDNRDVESGDVNGDGVPDLVAIDYTNDRLTIQIANTHETATTPYLNLNTVDGAKDAMGVLDAALGRISMELGAIGSSQSRLSVALNNLMTQRENYMAAASRITDVDVAAESAQLIKNQILQQAGAAILAQANQQPALVLNLLRV